MPARPDHCTPQPELDHARLRVDRLLAYLEEHRRLDTPRSVHWFRKEVDLIRQLANAQVELDKLEDG